MLYSNPHARTHTHTAATRTLLLLRLRSCLAPRLLPPPLQGGSVLHRAGGVLPPGAPGRRRHPLRRVSEPPCADRRLRRGAQGSRELLRDGVEVRQSPIPPLLNARWSLVKKRNRPVVVTAPLSARRFEAMRVVLVFSLFCLLIGWCTRPFGSPVVMAGVSPLVGTMFWSCASVRRRGTREGV